MKWATAIRHSGSPALRFVLTMGLVNLFADMTYEGGGAINGPFLGTLGASAVAISIVAGSGEFLGYSLRAVAGYVADKTSRYWVVTFIGYAINLLAVPAMALAGSWQIAATLIIAERVGRAIRKPTVEAMLSYTTGELAGAGSTPSTPPWTRRARRSVRSSLPPYSISAAAIRRLTPCC